MGSQGDSRGQGKMGNFSLARQASIYSLTLEEFQNTLGAPSKNFGSMNMDEFLKNIWTAEESQAMAAALGLGDGELGRQASLQRQGSLTIPRTLSRKTVDEVWRDINKETSGAQSNGVNPPPRQITYGEMTLEDFLVRAGVVREENIMNTNPNNTTISVSSNHFGGFNQFERVDNRAVGAANVLALDLSDRGTNVEIKNSVTSSTLPMAAAVNSSLAGEAKLDSMDAFKVSHAHTDWFGNTHRSPVTHQQQQATDAVAVYPSSVKRQTEGALMGSGFPGAGGVGLSPRINAAAAAMMGNGCHVGMGGMGMPAALGTASLNVQPVTPPAGQIQMDPMSLSHGDGSPVVSYGLDGALRGRRGGVSVEKIVERRQRRMIKNRESAARSRARKQAYTVELEAEVSQLKEENKELRQKQEEMAESRKRQFMEIMSSLSQNVRNKPKLRRTQTGPW